MSNNTPQPVVAKRSGQHQPVAPQRLHILDLVVFLVSVAVVGWMFASMLTTGSLSASLTADEQLSWHLVRSAGNTAYILLAASMFWGLLMVIRQLRQIMTTPYGLLLHATVSWLSVIVSLAHALLLLLDKYYVYTLETILIPFSGPYRPLAVGVGVVAFWILLTVNLSFSIRRFIGTRVWRWLHYTSYLAFILVTVHIVAAGTDIGTLGLRLVLGMSTTLILFVFVWRVRQQPASA